MKQFAKRFRPVVVFWAYGDGRTLVCNVYQLVFP